MRIPKRHERGARLFFGGHAFVAVMALVLITLFILREAVLFFPQYHEELERNRACGMELAEEMRAATDELLTPVQALRELQASLPDPQKEQVGTLAAGLEDAVFPLLDFVVQRQAEARNFRAGKGGNGKAGEATDVPGYGIASWERRYTAQFLDRWRSVRSQLRSASGRIPSEAAGMEALERWRAGIERQLRYPVEERLAEASPQAPPPYLATLGRFFLGHHWVTNSFNQDIYGLLPLFAGTLLVSGIASLLAIPLGVGSALYVNQFARPWERSFLKPGLEFLAAFPTVLLGFIGVVFWGEIVQSLTAFPLIRDLEGFPLSDRLNAFTAGTLLAFVAVPLIFTLSEDALASVSRDHTEASFSVGATRVQTLFRVVLPAASPGLVSAVLLGFGRLMGETMIVLLVAGNRIAIPGTMGGGTPLVFEPVHTMTGIIAQEMGEVSFGSLHYRALFVVAAMLFLTTLFFNHLARWITRPARRRAQMQAR